MYSHLRDTTLARRTTPRIRAPTDIVTSCHFIPRKAPKRATSQTVTHGNTQQITRFHNFVRPENRGVPSSILGLATIFASSFATNLQRIPERRLRAPFFIVPGGRVVSAHPSEGRAQLACSLTQPGRVP